MAKKSNKSLSTPTGGLPAWFFTVLTSDSERDAYCQKHPNGNIAKLWRSSKDVSAPAPKPVIQEKQSRVLAVLKQSNEDIAINGKKSRYMGDSLYDAMSSPLIGEKERQMLREGKKLELVLPGATSPEEQGQYQDLEKNVLGTIDRYFTDPLACRNDELDAEDLGEDFWTALREDSDWLLEKVLKDSENRSLDLNFGNIKKMLPIVVFRKVEEEELQHGDTLFEKAGEYKKKPVDAGKFQTDALYARQVLSANAPIDSALLEQAKNNSITRVMALIHNQNHDLGAVSAERAKVEEKIKEDKGLIADALKNTFSANKSVDRDNLDGAMKLLGQNRAVLFLLENKERELQKNQVSIVDKVKKAVG